VARAATLSFKFYLSTKMPQRGVTFAKKITLIEKTKNQPPNSSHRQVVKITGVSKSAIARVTQQQGGHAVA
jgi:hypothetical protein